MDHLIHPNLLRRRLHLQLVGCGGNGSQMLTGLARLDAALRALGHKGFFVCAWDPDAVSPANVARQLFSPADVCRNKATVLVHRVNSFFGLDWYAEPTAYAGRKQNAHTDLVVSCVDTREARSAIAYCLEYPGRHPYYWLDIGNRAADGQAILGIPCWNQKHRANRHRLPTVIDLFPEIRGRSARRLDRADRAPSCSLAEALGRQELFVNHLVCGWALQLLWQVFRHGRTDWHGAFVNAATGRVAPLPVDWEAWARFGYDVRPKPRKAKHTTRERTRHGTP